MPDKLASRLKAFASPAMMGLVAQAAPSVLKGLILEFLADIKIPVLQGYVEKNVSLWDLMDHDNQTKLKNICSRLKDVNWLTADWLVTSSRARIAKIRDRPKFQDEKTKLCALISYFLSSPRAYAWLEKQTLTIRRELTSK